MDEAPAIEVDIVKNTEPPGGMGEAGTSAMVPVVTNAIFAATDKRLPSCPLIQRSLSMRESAQSELSRLRWQLK